ncbi:MAG: ferritin-like domain-containing protein [Sulfurovaceae bacterium]|nr:ferritin-like domain-containing protein [Sulfurovaceae bacterium]
MAKWNYKKDIDYNAIDIEKIKENYFLLHLLAIASFIEITSETYTENLSEYYKDNTEVVQWLNDDWQKEEVQHGKALKTYIEHVWPQFPWQKAYERFLELYKPLCNIDEFQQTKALEMLARMIVETGTSTMYRTLEAYAKSLDEPILEHLSHNIYKDEVNHYSYFDHYFKYYNQSEKLGRKERFKVIMRRLKKINTEDIKIGYQSLHETEYNDTLKLISYEALQKELHRLTKKYYPYTMGIKMTMQPLNLNKTFETAITPIIRSAVKVLEYR